VDVPNSTEAQALQAEINAACEGMNQWVEQQVSHWMDAGKLVGTYRTRGDASRALTQLAYQPEPRW
jgi:hypothetical protein